MNQPSNTSRGNTWVSLNAIFRNTSTAATHIHSRRIRGAALRVRPARFWLRKSSGLKTCAETRNATSASAQNCMFRD